jgi:hypothetical protein
MATLAARRILIPSLVGNRVISPSGQYETVRYGLTKSYQYGYGIIPSKLASELEVAVRKNSGVVVIGEVFSNQKTRVQIIDYVEWSGDNGL